MNHRIACSLCPHNLPGGAWRNPRSPLRGFQFLLALLPHPPQGMRGVHG